MTALDRLHTFHAWQQPDGSAALELFRRSDLHELTQVALVIVKDKTVEPKRLAELMCQALDRELETRPKETRP